MIFADCSRIRYCPIYLNAMHVQVRCPIHQQNGVWVQHNTYESLWISSNHFLIEAAMYKVQGIVQVTDVMSLWSLYILNKLHGTKIISHEWWMLMLLLTEHEQSCVRHTVAPYNFIHAMTLIKQTSCFDIRQYNIAVYVCSIKKLVLCIANGQNPQLLEPLWLYMSIQTSYGVIGGLHGDWWGERKQVYQ